MAVSNANFTLWSWMVIVLLCNISIILSHENERSEETIVGTEEVEDEIVYSTPKPSGFVYIAESFDDLTAYKSRWILSDAKKEDTDESIAKYNGEWVVEAAVENALKGDLGLILKSKAKHHAISAKLNKPFVFDKKPFIVQYEVNFQNGQECGGAYIKLLTEDKALSLKNFHDKTPYTIMFGPDKCGTDSKLHFIFRHQNPRNGTITEKHCKPTTEKIEDLFKDKKPHLYTLVIRPDNSYDILVDNNIVNQGSLLEDFSPPVNPPAEIDDPNDKKPDDWDEKEKIPDPDAKKPDDWDEDAPRQITDPDATKPEDWLDDEPESIPDPTAIKPDDWDDEMDGEWEPPLINNPKCEKVGCGEWKAPLIENPKYKGKWHAPLIDNPNYKGKWKPRRIANPDFFEDQHPFKMAAIGAVGIELWSMSDGIYFDNVIITDDKSVAEQWAKETWELKRRKVDKGTFSFWPMIGKLAKNKPAWLWLMYFIYVGIPIVGYARYIQNRVKEEGFFTRIVNYTNSHPWLWAIYLVVIGLPLVLAIVFCCSSSEEKQEKKRAAKAKKTDLSTPDDEPPQPKDEKSGSGDTEIGADENKIDEDPEVDAKDHSGDEGVENDDEFEENEADEETGEESKVKEEVDEDSSEKADHKEIDEVVEEGSGSEQVSGNSGRSPRRRRTRKD